MYSDGHLSLLEDANLKKKIENLNWEEGQSSSMYLNQSIANARDADEIEEIIKIIETKAEILKTPEAKSFALQMAMDLLGCDEIIDSEKEFLSALKWALR